MSPADSDRTISNHLMKSPAQRACWILILLSSILVIAAAGALAVGQRPWFGPLLSGGLLCFALAAMGSPALKKWAFTIWICTTVVIAMTFPSWFIGVGDFKFTRLFVPILMVIMFCMGTTLSAGDFAGVLRMPTGVCVGLACQFTIMPLVGYALARLFDFPPEIAAGVVLVGVSPTGMASNVMNYIAKANVALSVTITALASLLAPILTPLLMKLLAGQMIEVDAMKMMWDITKMVVVPILAGLVFHHTCYQRIAWLPRVLPVLSMAGILVMTLLTIAIGRNNLLQVGAALFAACLLHNTAGYALAYAVCRMLRLSQTTCRTVAIEVGMQNCGLASGIAASLQKVATLGLAPIIFGPLMNLTASTLANWWRAHPVQPGQE